MITHIVLTALVFLLYLAARAPFRRLTLHYDTGFYVSNHTVTTSHVRFSKGWNARYAGCSKVIPEWLLGQSYVAARKKVFVCGGAIGDTYARTFRLRTTIVGFVTAITIGILAYLLGFESMGLYYAVLVALCLLTAEPQWGNYHECAEIFELLPQICSVLLLFLGIENQNGVLIGLAAFLWAADAYFIKLSSIVSFAILYTIAAFLHPTFIPAIAAGGVVATILYLAWCRLNGHSFGGMFASLTGHETAFHRRASFATIAHRVREKLACLSRVVAQQPIVPVFAVVGVSVGGYQQTLVFAYFASVFAAYLAQATDCRYYLIPLLPPMAFFAGIGAAWIWNAGSIGPYIVIAAIVLWTLHNTIRAIFSDERSIDRWCWRGFRPAHEIERNQLLAREAPSIANLVQERSMFVYGPLTQAYVLVGASYDVALVTPDHHLDDMHRGWQTELNCKLIQDPPAFVLDTGKCFAAKTSRDVLGLDYRLVWFADLGLLLYELKTRDAPGENYQTALTYSSQSETQLAEERELMTSAGVSDPITSATTDHLIDDAESRLKDLLQEIRAKGHRRLAVFGAGRFTTRYADVYRSSPLSVELVLDDDATRHGERFLGWPIRRPNDVPSSDLDAVVISTDRFAAPMMRRAREEWQGRVAVYAIE